VNHLTKRINGPEALILRNERSSCLEGRGRHALYFPCLSPKSAPSWFETRPHSPSLATGVASNALWGALTMRELMAVANGALISLQSLRTSKADRHPRLAFGHLLYGLGIGVIGSEYFALWQSKTWNRRDMPRVTCCQTASSCWLCSFQTGEGAAGSDLRFAPASGLGLVLNEHALARSLNKTLVARGQNCENRACDFEHMFQ
jgi:hypothetical protein